MSLRINEEDLVCQVMEEVKPSDSKSHVSLFYHFDKNTLVFINLTWPSKTGSEFPTKVTFFGWIYYLHVVVCSLAKTNLGICNNLPAVNS